ncbi:MAG: DUF6286 domain-containing protein [Sciscionella sp.]
MRIAVRILAALLGLAIAVLGGLLLIEAAWHWWRPTSGPLLVPWRRWQVDLSGWQWDSEGTQFTAAVVAVVGLVLMLIAALARQRSVRLRDPADEVSVSTSRRSVARLVGHRVRAEDGVRTATVTATARQVRVRATSQRHGEAELAPKLREVIGEQIERLPMLRRPKVTIVVDSPRDRP